VASEKSGVPSVTVHTTGFQASALSTAQGLGMPNLRTAEYPGMIDVHSKDEIRKNVTEVLVDRIARGLTEPIKKAETLAAEPGPREIVFKGTFEEVNAFFYKNLWSDGLPIVPPTIAKVEAFLKYTDRSPTEVIGILPPGLRKASIWSIAVNGVVAGCRPEYMPVLIAVVEAIADPHFYLKNVGSTGGWDSVIILNGPIIKQLGFNFTAGVLRPGNQANSSVGRFLRLYLRNVPRFLPGSSDMAAFGSNFWHVLAENEVDSPWRPNSVEWGFKPGTNLVTVNSIHSMSRHTTSNGDTAKEQLTNIARLLVKEFDASNIVRGECHPMVVMTPVIAEVIANEGFSKKDVRQYLFDHARISAAEMESGEYDFDDTICNLVKKGTLSKLFCESQDPKRMLPVFHSPDELYVIVSGDIARNRVLATSQGGDRGLGTTKEIKLPANWDKLLQELAK
jgi:hypothetical protein